MALVLTTKVAYLTLVLIFTTKVAFLMHLHLMLPIECLA